MAHDPQTRALLNHRSLPSGRRRRPRVRLARSAVVLAAVAALGLALAPLAAQAAPAASSMTGTVVTTRQTTVGPVLYTAHRQALYVFSADTVGTAGTPAVSACTGTCASAWPPLLAATASGPFDVSGGVDASALGTTTRTDNGQTEFQVTYFGQPLYLFVADAAPGELKGENVAAFGGIWHPVDAGGRPDAGVARVELEASPNGSVTSTPTAFGTHRSLYSLTADPPGRSTCTGACATVWPPLLTTGAPLAGRGVDASAIGVIGRPDGTMQVTYHHHPLYLFTGDMAAGAPSGQTMGEYLVDQFAAGVWYTLGPEGTRVAGAAPIASESASQGTILGFDSPSPFSSRPFALYVYSADGATRSACTGVCARFWPPVLTSAPPVAADGSGVQQSELGVIKRANGTFQVTYFGHPLYFFAFDQPGQTLGENITVGAGTFQVLTTAGAPS